MPRSWIRSVPVTLVPLVLLTVLPALGAAQDEALCSDAERFMVEDRGMLAVVEADTLNDWRTGLRVPGCRVTAAGLSTRALRDEAIHFYERIRAAGWVRTPDPRDAPGEASLRFRMDGNDCLFNIYEGMLLFTEAEIKVSSDLTEGPGEGRYNLYVFCMPAMDAKPRDPPG